MNHKNYHSNISFLDLFLNTLLGFVFLFLVSWLLINPIAKNKITDAKGEFMITVNWPDDSIDDVDLWVKDPTNDVLYYGKRETKLVHLDRDDLGLANDTLVRADGSTYEIRINREIATIRGIYSGEYIVNIHMYNKREKKETPVNIEVIKINPYQLVINKKIVLTSHSQEETVIRFKVKDDGSVYGMNEIYYSILSDFKKFFDQGVK